MKHIQSEPLRARIAKMAAMLVFFLSLTASAFSQTNVASAALAVSSVGPLAPAGVKVLARIPLAGQPVSGMFTQWEHGRTYLYIEHAGQLLTTVDVTNKRHPRVVNHEPAKVEPKRYEELAEGGTIEVAPRSNVETGFDNTVGGRGVFSVLESSDPGDAQLLQSFGRESSNLADSDRHLIFFASPAQLLIVEDGRWKAVDYTANN